MKRHGLLVATLLTLLLTGFVLPTSGWLNARASRSSPHSGDCLNHAKAADPYATDACWRWRQNQPNHWRACLLQH
jgi:hypothetical protein